MQTLNPHVEKCTGTPLLTEEMTSDRIIGYVLNKLNAELEPEVTLWSLLRKVTTNAKPICVAVLYHSLPELGVELSLEITDYLEGCKQKFVLFNLVSGSYLEIKSGKHSSSLDNCRFTSHQSSDKDDASDASPDHLFGETQVTYELPRVQRKSNMQSQTPDQPSSHHRSELMRVVFDDGSEEPKVMHLDPMKVDIAMRLISVL